MNSYMLPNHYNSLGVEEEEESSHPCVECEDPRKLLLQTHQLIPPLKIGFERFEENKWTSITLCIEVTEE